MSKQRADHDDQNARVPWQQKVIDNIWLLLALGTLVPLAIYFLWGLWELANVPLWGGR